ncbi:MAG: hypothetical protein H6553_09985 [Chitinophagales bacterium]|nr:hypothetical protein [Chitinophagales bacterium]
MKKLLLTTISLLCFVLTNAQSMGVNTNTPDASAILDVYASDKGFLPPRMTAQKRDSIASPAAGLMIFCTTSNCLNFYDGTVWKELCGSTAPLGHICGEPFTDSRDGEVYQTVSIGGVCWMAENLRFNPGANVWAGADSTQPDSVGLYYNWNGASLGSLPQNGIPGTMKGACPVGWHVPTKDEWTALETAVGGSITGGNALKRGDQGSSGQTNASGFSGLLAGYYVAGYGIQQFHSNAYFWSATEYNSAYNYGRTLFNPASSFAEVFTIAKTQYYSLRCIKD